MSDYRCPVHPDTKLVYVLRGAVGFCAICHLYTRAAGVPEPTREAPKAAGSPRKANKARKARKKEKAR
jgi:hypothetical protein